MAEFLIKNHTSGDETPGDIVEVRPDGSPWARLERDPGRFIIVKVPGLDYQASLNLHDALTDNTDPENPVMLRRRRFSIEDAMAGIGSYHTGEDNIYEVPVVASWNSFLKDFGSVT